MPTTTTTTISFNDADVIYEEADEDQEEVEEEDMVINDQNSKTDVIAGNEITEAKQDVEDEDEDARTEDRFGDDDEEEEEEERDSKYDVVQDIGDGFEDEAEEKGFGIGAVADFFTLTINNADEPL